MKSTTSFELINGKNIFTISSPAGADSKNIVIMCHGFKGNSTGASRTFVNFSRKLTHEGFSVLRFDQPNSGNSDGDFIDSSFTEWVQTIVYFAKKYSAEGYRVSLLGHSMGANAALIAAVSDELKDKIPVLLLWTPDPKTDPADWYVPETKQDGDNNIREENGQKYGVSFWEEVKNADFFACLKKYRGTIHLVYGEHDKYVSADLRKKVIATVKQKGQEVLILKDQDHLGWSFDMCEKVYDEEIEILKRI